MNLILKKLFSKKFNRTIIYGLVALIVIVSGVIIVRSFYSEEVIADEASTTATVGNVVPSFTVDPVEAPASHNGAGTGDTADNPTNVGSDITFQATATDSNGDQWKLLVCDEAGTAGTDCTNGGDHRWCVSATAVDSGSQNTCSETVLDGDPESNAWHAYACDAVGCSTVSQGTGNSGTPFYVNHEPAFSVYGNDGPKNPNVTATFTSTSSDTDSDAAADTVRLFVCTTAAFTGGASPACTVSEICHTDPAAASNVTCSITSARPDGGYTGYGYIVDNHGLASGGVAQGTSSELTVNNIAPAVTNSTIQLLDTDETGDLTLTSEEAETTGFKVKFTVTDDNSCENISAGDEISSAIINVYRSSVTSGGCDITGEYNANSCYPDDYATWNPSCVQDGGSCSGNTDTDANWTCTFPFQYHTDPTVDNSTHSADTWLVSVQATDDDSSASSLTETTNTTREMGQFLQMNLTTASIAYGSIAPEGDSDEKTTTIEATGNVGLDETLYGVNMASNGDSIPVGQQKYNLTAVQGWGGTGSTALLVTPGEEAELNCSKTTTTGTPASANTYWVLRIPTAQPSGAYSGTNTFTAVTSEFAGW